MVKTPSLKIRAILTKTVSSITIKKDNNWPIPAISQPIHQYGPPQIILTLDLENPQVSLPKKKHRKWDGTPTPNVITAVVQEPSDEITQEIRLILRCHIEHWETISLTEKTTKSLQRQKLTALKIARTIPILHGLRTIQSKTIRKWQTKGSTDSPLKLSQTNASNSLIKLKIHQVVGECLEASAAKEAKHYAAIRSNDLENQRIGIQCQNFITRTATKIQIVPPDEQWAGGNYPPPEIQIRRGLKKQIISRPQLPVGDWVSEKVHCGCCWQSK